MHVAHQRLETGYRGGKTTPPFLLLQCLKFTCRMFLFFFIYFLFLRFFVLFRESLFNKCQVKNETKTQFDTRHFKVIFIRSNQYHFLLLHQVLLSHKMYKMRTSNKDSQINVTNTITVSRVLILKRTHTGIRKVLP